MRYGPCSHLLVVADVLRQGRETERQACGVNGWNNAISNTTHALQKNKVIKKLYVELTETIHDEINPSCFTICG